MRKLPPLNSLRAFEATARLQGVQKASEELHVTHGAISKQLKQLEQWLGLALFDRSARTIQLNVAGKRYLKTISSVLDLLEQSSINLQNLKPKNSLGISTTHSIASKWLVDALKAYALFCPQVDVCLSLEQACTDFANPDVDLAVRMGEGPWDNLHCIALKKDRLIVVASPTLVKQPLLESQQLQNYSLIHDQDPSTQWLRWFTENNLALINLNSGPRYSSSDIVLNSAISGQGIALVSEQLAVKDLQRGDLIQVLPQCVELGSYFWLVMPREKYLDTRVSEFCDWFEGLYKSSKYYL